VPTASLPDNPDIEQLKRHAKTLRDLVRAGAGGAVDLVRAHHPQFPGLVAGSPDATGFKLTDAQLTMARHHGFASWPRLRVHVALVNGLTRSPHTQPVGGDVTDDDRADELLRLACLNYGADDPARWRAAGALLDAHPELSRASIHTAAATGDITAATTLLASDPGSASREGGPFRWVPLLYLAYSRLDADRPGADPVAVARLLLDHGADPDAGYLWEGLPSPFTALTGAFGGGEQGAPPHPRELELARLLLEAGAEANDSQTIYNRGAGGLPDDDTEFLALLLDFGLGRGDGGPWRRRLGSAHQTPAELVAEALQHAAEAGLVRRVRLLLERGADPDAPGVHPLYRGRRPYEGAVLHGNLEIARLLAAAGARTDTVDPFTGFVGACLAGNRAAVERAVADDPQLLARALAERGDLITGAVELGRPDAVELLVELGFDVNARSRATALHEAAFRGDLDLVELLLRLGADPAITDPSFQATPRGWAEHNRQTHVVAYLDERPA
jgi:ankyrin repeat protein